MSNSASISAAKKRRGGTPPMTGNGGVGGGGLGMNTPPGLPPGLPPNFRQLPPHIQQQMFIQLQQRAAAAKMGQPPQPPHPSSQQSHSMPPAPIQTRPPSQSISSGNNTMSVPGPYTVNSVLHNRATAEVNGVHIRDLPISSAGLPCSPSGGALPPNVLFKLHHDELLNMDAILNEHSNKIQMCVNRVENVERSHGVSNVGDNNFNNGYSYHSLVNNTEFITKLLDNILTNTNLSDIINQIEPLQKENELLRGLLNSQQTTLNELSGLVMKLIANGLPARQDSIADSVNNQLANNVEDVTMYNAQCVGQIIEQSTEQYNTESMYVYDPNTIVGVDGSNATMDNIEEVEGEETEEGEEGEEEATDDRANDEVDA